MSKHILAGDFDFDFKLLGIISHAQDYRLSWAINQKIKIQLERDKEIELFEKNKPILFSSFSYFPDDSEKEYRLIANKNKQHHLVPEQKHANFLLHLYDVEEEELQKIINKLKMINVVLMCFEINVSNLKSKENLVF